MTSTARVRDEAEAPPLDRSSLTSTVRRQHRWETLRVEGRLPSALAGTVIRTGPGIFERFGRRVEHAFEADGVLVGLRIADGVAEGAVRVVESPGWLAEERAGASLFGSTTSWWRRVTNGFRGRNKATGNTSLMCWQDRAYALMEAGRPLEIDPHTLDTRGPSDFDGVIAGGFSAHPHRAARGGATINFGQHYGPDPHLALYAMPDTGPARRLGRVSLPWNAMVHDFAVTEHHAVFVICPLKARMLRALLGARGISGIFAWAPESGAQLLVVPLADIERPIRVAIAPRFVFHLANAHEHRGELVVDIVEYANADVVTVISGNDHEGKRSRSRLQRVRVDLRTHVLRADEALWDAGCEFPVVPAPQVGESYGALWLVAGSGDARGVARIDPRSGAVDEWSPGRGVIASEPMFVPRRGGAVEDGWVVSLTLDASIPESFFAILDARALSSGPIARIWTGQPLHSTYHGVYLPS